MKFTEAWKLAFARRYIHVIPRQRSQTHNRCCTVDFFVPYPYFVFTLDVSNSDCTFDIEFCSYFALRVNY